MRLVERLQAGLIESGKARGFADNRLAQAAVRRYVYVDDTLAFLVQLACSCRVIFRTNFQLVVSLDLRSRKAVLSGRGYRPATQRPNQG